ncbi:XdhC family protein [Streptomyces sp. NPDC047000]|uniref:XdhC family protein n=1 Tax=Streptomyces sp. NPDC047000 TaxID=3155474 RepID=UPI0033E42104
MLNEVWPFVEAHHGAGERVVLARLVDRDGPGSRPLGATMAVAVNGDWTGSVSGGCVEGILLSAAREVLDGEPPHLTTVRPGDELLPWEPAPACSSALRILITPAPRGEVAVRIGQALTRGTALTVGCELESPHRWSTDPATLYGPLFVEELTPRPRLVLIGATDLAAVTAAMARPLGRRVLVLDPRPDYARPERVPHAEVVMAWPQRWLAANPLTAADAVLVISHDPRIDDPAIRAALTGAAGYVGALGSRATHEARLRRLAPVRDERLAGPAGLDLGGASLAETALSMIAEIVAVVHGRPGGRLRDSRSPIRQTLRTAARYTT